MLEKRDYADSGMTIQQALLDDSKSFPRNGNPDNSFIVWGGSIIRTALQLKIAKPFGLIRIQFKARAAQPRQGLDVKVEGGALISERGDRFPHLRTWAEDKYEDVLEYAIDAPTKAFFLWNCFETQLPNGIVR